MPIIAPSWDAGKFTENPAEGPVKAVVVLHHCRRVLPQVPARSAKRSLYENSSPPPNWSLVKEFEMN